MGTIAGTSAITSPPNSPTVLLSSPVGICTDSNDNLYVADSGLERIVTVDREGRFSLLAGNGPVGDGSSAGKPGKMEYEMPFLFGLLHVHLCMSL